MLFCHTKTPDRTEPTVNRNGAAPVCRSSGAPSPVRGAMTQHHHHHHRGPGDRPRARRQQFRPSAVSDIRLRVLRPLPRTPRENRENDTLPRTVRNEHAPPPPPLRKPHGGKAFARRSHAADRPPNRRRSVRPREYAKLKIIHTKTTTVRAFLHYSG